MPFYYNSLKRFISASMLECLNVHRVGPLCSTQIVDNHTNLVGVMEVYIARADESVRMHCLL